MKTHYHVRFVLEAEDTYLANPPDRHILLRQTPGSLGTWEDFTFHMEDKREEYDFVIVGDGMDRPLRLRVPPERTILWTWEPDSVRSYRADYCSQFHWALTCQRRLPHPRVFIRPQAQNWRIEKSFDELVREAPPEKPRLLSMISSNKGFTQGHLRRLRLAFGIAEVLGGTRCDFFGRGLRDFDRKWDVLAPYRFSVAMENCTQSEYISEKVIDCFLSHTFPFYWGCAELEKYFPADSFWRIDDADPARAGREILACLKQPDFYQSRMAALTEARRRVLHEQQLFPLAVGLMRELLALTPAAVARPLELLPEQVFAG